MIAKEMTCLQDEIRKEKKEWAPNWTNQHVKRAEITPLESHGEKNGSVLQWERELH